MNRKSLIILLTVCLLILMFIDPSFASEVTPISEYQFVPDPDLPKVLPVGETVACGNYSLRIVQQPVLGKYTNKLISDNDLEYLMVRVEITNVSSEVLGWVSPESFDVIDTYKGRMYSTYHLDITASAATVQAAGQQLFLEKIDPGKSMLTTLVFSVYPDVEGWVMRFAPRYYYEDNPLDVITFQLPAVKRYSEGVF